MYVDVAPQTALILWGILISCNFHLGAGISIEKNPKKVIWGYIVLSGLWFKNSYRRRGVVGSYFCWDSWGKFHFYNWLVLCAFSLLISPSSLVFFFFFASKCCLNKTAYLHCTKGNKKRILVPNLDPEKSGLIWVVQDNFPIFRSTD